MTMGEMFGFPSKQDKYNLELFIGLSTKLVEKNILTEDEVIKLIDEAKERTDKLK
jgi:hypothetical protein